MNTPIKMNGIPNPNEYASNRWKDIVGDVAAKVSMLPRIGPTQGVHAAANANPKTNESG